MTDQVRAKVKRIPMEEVIATAGLEEYKGMEIEDGVWVPKHDFEDKSMSVQHGQYGGELFGFLWEFVKSHQLGKVYMSETIFVLHEADDGTEIVRKPDIAFVTTERVIPPKKGSYYHQAPDLAVEIISPSERIGRIRKKLREYFTYGTREVWLVYSDDQEIVVYTSPDQSTTYKVGETIPGGSLLPGLALDVAKIFAS